MAALGVWRLVQPRKPGLHTSLARPAVLTPQHSTSQTPSVTTKMEDCTARRDRVFGGGSVERQGGSEEKKSNKGDEGGEKRGR